MSTRNVALSAIFTLALLWTGLGSSAAAEPPRDFGRLNPEAPPETAQFAFMVGEWDCTVKSMRPDGTTVEGRASWTGYYILDGWAIQDDWISYGKDGKESHGTNIRSFNRELGKWEARWLPAGSLQWKYFTMEKVGDTVVMNGSGKDANGEFLDRNTFSEITTEGFRWQKDRSYDGGKKWFEAVSVIQGKRRR